MRHANAPSWSWEGNEQSCLQVGVSGTNTSLLTIVEALEICVSETGAGVSLSSSACLRACYVDQTGLDLTGILHHNRIEVIIAYC